MFYRNLEGRIVDLRTPEEKEAQRLRDIEKDAQQILEDARSYEDWRRREDVARKVAE
jgi:hypothetical protein